MLRPDMMRDCIKGYCWNMKIKKQNFRKKKIDRKFNIHRIYVSEENGAGEVNLKL